MSGTISAAEMVPDTVPVTHDGLAKNPPGSTGNPSRAATTKVLNLPSAARAAHCWASRAAALENSWVKAVSSPPTFCSGDWILTVPLTPVWDEASTRVFGSAMKTRCEVIVMPRLLRHWPGQ